MSQPTSTLILLFTDVENSTQLWETCGHGMGGSLRRHDAILEEVVAVHGGSLFKRMGDGIAATFPAALVAVLDAQRRLIAEPWDEDCPALKVRMGLHIGAPEERDGDYFGTAVNRAARLCELGHGGQVLISQAVHALLSNPLPADFTFLPLGDVHLRGTTHPETVFQVCAPGLPTEFPPLRGTRQALTNLPEPLSSFVGREEALRQVASDLKRHRLLTLCQTPLGGGTPALLVNDSPATAYEQT